MLKAVNSRPPSEWLVSMVRRGYRIQDMANGRIMSDVASTEAYFGTDEFFKAVPSSHTDLILSLP
jgi:hypothetical protein